MEAIKQKLAELIAEMPEAELTEVMDFIGYLRLKRGKGDSGHMLKAIEDSEEFWREVEV